ncbi:auxin efflux carrier [Russula aff. rugulosa BPL654]|nr:auxin efflux carrier [Russula aff. rugulosa BPL654]
MVFTGALVWTSIRPLIRTFLTVGAGFTLNKVKLFPTEASRGGAQVVLNVALPCLLFSYIIPAIGTHNVSSLAPLAVVGVIYGVTGTLMAWTIRSFFWVPHRFRYGILAAGCWGNYGDMPAAVALGITASAPFNGVEDQQLAIAYISMFVFLFFITLFPLGGFLVVAKDFEGPDVPSEELRKRMYLRRRRMFTNTALLLRRLLCLSQHPNTRETLEDEEGGEVENLKTNAVSSIASTGKDEGLDQSTFTGIVNTPAPGIVISSDMTASQDDGPGQNTITGITIIPTPTIGLKDNGSKYMPTATSLTIHLPQQPTVHHSSHRHHHDLISRLRHFLRHLLKPCTIVIVLSFVISLVDPLKALFIPPSSTFQPHFRPVAPDGQPPLAFIFDTATFIGGACIPLGLICVGSALASLSLRSGGPFPKCAIASLALGKMVVIPIIGIAITRGFVHVGFVHGDDKVLQFVCILLSGLPAASTQVYLTQTYSRTGSVEHLSAFLIPQYILMPFTMTGLVAYTLNYLF